MDIEIVRSRVRQGNYLIEGEKNDNPPVPVCAQHQISKEWRLTTFEYREGNISIRIPNTYAWVCPSDAEASFTPETVDELILTIRELLATARRARERRSGLTEYVVSVG